MAEIRGESHYFRRFGITKTLPAESPSSGLGDGCCRSGPDRPISDRHERRSGAQWAYETLIARVSAISGQVTATPGQ